MDDQLPVDEAVIVDHSEYEDTISSFEIRTNSHYIKRRSFSCFGKTDINNKQHKLLWNLQHPYMVLKTAILECHHGPVRKKKHVLGTMKDHEYGKRRIRLQPSKKRSCPAVIVAREIIIFMDFESSTLSKWQKDKLARKLKLTLKNGDGNFRRKIHVKFPHLSEHKNHSHGIAEEMSLPVDPRIVAKSEEYLSEGFLSSNTIRLLLEQFVKKELFSGKTCPPWSNRRFFPMQRDIANMVYNKRRKRIESKCDQENLISKIAEWRTDAPEDSIHFKPAVNDKDDFIFVYQSKFQKQLLKRYGNEVCLLDATYRTTRYAMPVFFLCVKTNVSYGVVATFSTILEDQHTIAKALAIIKEWNPQWNPPFFMVDNCEAEIKAIKKTFQGCTIYLCDFHREQAWIRWMKTGKNGLNHSSDAALNLLRNIARSESVEAFNDSVKKLQSSTYWKSNLAFRNWISRVWLKNAEKWVWCYRVNRFNLKVNTNNGVERQSRTLKYDYLRHYNDRSLTGMLQTVIKRFLPEMHQRYIRSNIMASSEYRQYSSILPKFLQNRPKPFADHCRKRLPVKEEIQSAISQTKNGFFKVPSFSSSSVEYIVSLGNHESMPSCQCYDWLHTHWPCKHLLAVVMYHPESSWESLPERYRNHPLFTLDEECVIIPDIEEDNYNSDNELESNISEINSPAESLTYSDIKLSDKLRREVDRIRSMSYLQLPTDVLISTIQVLEEVNKNMWAAVPKESGLPVLQNTQPL